MSSAPPELVALLNACRATPADDTPRLVLADWLDEHGEHDRAELIRVQCESASPILDAERAATLRRAERELILANWQRWAGDLLQIVSEIRDEVNRREMDPAATTQQQFLERIRAARQAGLEPPPLNPPPPVRVDPLARWNPWSFRRGLLRVELTRDVLSDERFLRWCLGPEAVWLEEAAFHLPGLGVLPQWDVPAAVRTYLGLTARVTLSSDDSAAAREARQELHAALTCRNFEFVRTLSVTVADPDPRTARSLLAAGVRRVTRLTLTGPGVTDDTIAAFAAAPFHALSELNISGNDLGPAAAKSLAGSRSLRSLVSLMAWRNRFGDDGIIALAESPLAGALNRVELMNTGLGDRGVAALVRSPIPAHLYGPGLNLSMNRIGDAGAKALAGCEYLARFSELILRENHIGDAGVQALAASPYVANLTHLDLWRNRIGDGGAEALAASESIGRTRDLSLRDNAITPKGAAALSERYGDRAKV